MNQDKIVQLKQGLSTAFINQDISSNYSVEWLPADQGLIPQIEQLL